MSILPTNKALELVECAKVELHGNLAHLENELGQYVFHTLVDLAKKASAILETNKIETKEV